MAKENKRTAILNLIIVLFLLCLHQSSEENKCANIDALQNSPLLLSVLFSF